MPYLVRSLKDVPPELQARRGEVFVVNTGATVLPVFRLEESAGLSGLLGVFTQIGAIGASFIPGAGPIISAGLSTAGGLLSARSSGRGAERQIAAEWDRAAAQLTQLFDRIEGQALITEDDYQAAVGGYQALAAAAAQYGGIRFVAEHWASPYYRAAYEERLARMRARVAPSPARANTKGGGGGVASPKAGEGEGAALPPWAIAAAAGGALLLLVRRHNQ